MSFTQGQTKYSFELRAHLGSLSSFRFHGSDANRIAGQRPACHCLNNFPSLFLIEIGARLNGTYNQKHKKQKSHPQITQKRICVICEWIGSGPSHITQSSYRSTSVT